MGKFQKIIIILILVIFCPGLTIRAQDTINVTGPSRSVFKAESMRATMLAVAFPGLGQIYNRKYWKLPLVYAGFGGLVYSASYNGSHYNKMMKAYQDFTDNIPRTDSYIELITWADPSDYDPVLAPGTYDASDAEWVKDRLLNAVDYYKKYRDLSYIGIAAWYLLTVLDANVDASLFNYDISNNLELAVTPLQQVPLTPLASGAGLNLSLIVTF